MENETRLAIGYGLARGNDAFAAGVEAARQAFTHNQVHPPSLVLVFASVRFDLEKLLQGVETIVGNVPVVGATTAGEICNGPHQESVVVTILTSPQLEVAVGLGQGVSENWQQAVAQAVSGPQLAPFFCSDDNTAWSELTLQGKSAFALMFAPGETSTTVLRSSEILEELKRRSQGRLPIIGGCAGDDLRMEENYVLWGRRAYPDSLLLVVCRTQLRFGIAMAHGLKPTSHRALVTRACNHEVVELDGQAAVEVYSRMQGHSRESLEGKHLTLVTERPMGTLDPYGQYSINVAAYFTSHGALRMAHPVSEGTILTIMEGTPESVANAGQVALRKALLRGSITQAAAVLAFSCVLRASFLGDLLSEEIRGMQQILPEIPITGFYSMGEQGLADDGVNRNNTEVITVLALGRELSYPAQVALENQRLHNEVERVEALKVAYAALEKEMAERQKAEQALRDNERFLANIFDSIQDGLTVLDKDFTIRRVNLTMEKWFPQAQPMVGKKCYAARHNHQTPCEVCPPRHTLKTGETTHKIVRAAHGGEAIWIDIYGYPLVDPANGKITGVIEIAKDITEQVEAQETLRQSQEKFRLVTETIQDVFWMSDPEIKKIAYVSPAYEHLWGQTCQSLYDSPRSFIDSIHPEDREQALATILTGLSQGASFDHEYRIIHPDGSVRWIYERGFPVKDEQGHYYMMTGVATDITARKQAEAEIIRQREELRGLAAQLAQVEEAERQQLARELHDQVCQNLASINIALESIMIRARRESTDQLLSRLSNIGAVAEQTGEIVRNIMEGLRPTVLDHYGLMGGLRQWGDQFSQRTGIDLEVLGEEADCRLQPNVELALFRIAQEALNNVAKHAKASHVALTKEIDQDRVRLVIADNGSGFDQDIVDHPKEGRRWGLITMTERAMAVGGTCRIESQPGQGTRVVIEVPRGSLPCSKPLEAELPSNKGV